MAVTVSLYCAAHAEPLVKKENGTPAPGVIVEWRAEGKKVFLKVRDGVDPKEVADAINDGVEKVKANVKGGEVQVKGKSQADLLYALTEVEFGDADFGALAAADMVEEDDGSGSSLRAKKSADMAKLLADSKTVVLGKVDKVGFGKFPHTTVTVQVLRAPTGALSKTIRKGKKIKFTPMIKATGKSPDWSDEATQLNAGGWFLKKGDRVLVKVADPVKGGFAATVIDRQ